MPEIGMKYRAHPVSVSGGTTKNGKMFHAVELLLDTGETMTWTGWWSGGAAKRTDESLQLMGWDGRDGIDTTKEVEVVIGVDSYGGVERPRIDWINAVGGGRGMTSPQTREDRAAFERQIDAIRAQLGTLPNAQKNDDKVPF